MTLIIPVDKLHVPQGGIKRLPRRRRLLSTIAKQHAPKDRATVALVFRKNEDWRLATKEMLDRAARMRAQYKETLVGPDDTVLFVTPATGGKSGLSIALSIAAIALLIFAPWAGAAVGGGLLGFAVQTGMVIGASLLTMAAQRADAAKKSGDTEFYNIAPSGNVARRGARRPLGYGRYWHTPPLSQKDYFRYIGNKQTVLVKRLTLGLGKWDVEEIRVGESTFWKKVGGVQSPFNVSSLFGIPSTVEFLYEEASDILPGDVATSDSVVGQELPRPGENPSQTPWYRVTPSGVSCKKVYMAWSFLSVMRRGDKGQAKPMDCGIAFQFRRRDSVTGNIVPGSTYTDATNIAYVYLPEGGHFGREFEFPVAGEWEACASNAYFDPSTIELEASNAVCWDEMSALLPDTRVRQGTTEVVLRVSGIKGMSSLGDIGVLATRILPVWDGATWTEQPTRKCVWAFADLVRSEYGLGRPNGVDLDKCLEYAQREDLEGYDTFDGELDNVTSFGPALNTVLGPLRAQHQRKGSVYSFARDESAEEAGGRTIISRRQALIDTTSHRFIFHRSDTSNGDIVVEFNRDGDPQRPDEVRQTLFATTRTPKRYKMPGISTGEHAVAIANWLGAIDRYRGAERTLSTEWEGRLVFPGTHVETDLHFVSGKAAVGARLISGTSLLLDPSPSTSLSAGATYASLRDKWGREWGLVRATYDGDEVLTLNSSDVAARAAATGHTLAEIMADELHEPNTVVIGDLDTLQENYIVKSARPINENQMELELVWDNPKVWLALGETPITPTPPDPEGPQDPLRPNVLAVRATCERLETSIQLIWSVTQPRGGVTYDVEYAYDDPLSGKTTQDWQSVQSQLANASGSVIIRQSDDPVRVRARAYGRTGLPGDWAYASFTTVPPKIDGSAVEVVDLTLEQMDTHFRELIAGTGPGSIGEAKNIASNAITLINSVFGNVEDLRKSLSSDPSIRATTQTTARYLREDLEQVMAVVQDAQTRLEMFSGILTQIGVVQKEGSYAIAGEAVLDDRINKVGLVLDALSGRVDLIANTVIQGDLSGLTYTVNQLSITLDAAMGELALKVTHAQLDEVDDKITDLNTTMNGPEGTVTTLTTQVNTLSGNLSSAILQIGAIGNILIQTNATNVKLEGDQRDATLEELLNRLAVLEGITNARITSVTETINSRLTESGEAISETSKTLLSYQGATAARFVQVERVVTDGLSSSVTVQRALEAQSADSAGRIANLETVVSGPQSSSVIKRIESMEAKVNTPVTGIEAKLTTVTDVVGNASGGLVRQLNDMQVSVFGSGPGDTTSINARLTAAATVIGNAASPGVPASGLVSKVANLELALAGDGTEANPGLTARVSTVEDASIGPSGTAYDVATAAAGTASEAQATANNISASGKVQMLVTAAPSGATAAYTIAVKVGAGAGTLVESGISFLAMSDGTSQILLNAGQMVSKQLAADGINWRVVFDLNNGSLSFWR